MLGELKPLLTALVLPPTGLLLLLALGLLFAGPRRQTAALVAWLALGLLWAMSTPAVVHRLTWVLLERPSVSTAAALKASKAQAIVVLGGGIEALAPEWGSAQLSDTSMQRLRYGVHLARQTGLPLAFAGGVGWSNSGMPVPTEAEVAAAAAMGLGVPLRWTEARSRDTHENANRTAELLLPAGYKRIALVTSATHMQRSQAEFRRAGFEVLVAPTDFPGLNTPGRMAWLPSTGALRDAHQMLREALGLQVMRWRQP